MSRSKSDSLSFWALSRHLQLICRALKLVVGRSAALVAKLGAARARVIADRAGDADTMQVHVEGTGLDATAIAAAVADILKLKGEVICCAPGTLPRDGLVIEDRRSYDT
jgi:phenylacetate-CoA ligase